MAEELNEGDLEDFKELLASIGRTHMPFGKYGPTHWPPHGVPLYDLPPEYLLWFKRKGFPGGKLGRMMDLVFETKVNGADHVFNEFRSKRGGRTDLREKTVKRRKYKFDRE